MKAAGHEWPVLVQRCLRWISEQACGRLRCLLGSWQMHALEVRGGQGNCGHPTAGPKARVEPTEDRCQLRCCLAGRRGGVEPQKGGGDINERSHRRSGQALAG